MDCFSPRPIDSVMPQMYCAKYILTSNSFINWLTLDKQIMRECRFIVKQFRHRCLFCGCHGVQFFLRVRYRDPKCQKHRPGISASKFRYIYVFVACTAAAMPLAVKICLNVIADGSFMQDTSFMVENQWEGSGAIN